MRYLAPMNHERGTGRRAFENRDWNESDVATLRAEWATGASTAEIGRRMGITKNAVIGKARRLGLPAREAPANIAKQTGLRVRQKAQPSAGRDAFSFPGQSRPVTPCRPRAEQPGAAAATAHGGSSSQNLPEVAVMPPRVFSGTECRHPIGDRTCDEPVQANARGLKSSYCPEHFALIHAAPPAKSATNPPPATWLKNRMAMRARG